MRHRILVYLLVLASHFTQSAFAAEQFPVGDFAELRETGMGKVVNVIDPQTLQLNDGRILRLAGLDFPDLGVYDAGDFSLMATDILRDMFGMQDVRIFQTSRKDWGRSNHLGHEIVHLQRKSDGAWAQGTLLSLGLARVMTTQRNPEMSAQMLALEDEARTAKLGLWENKNYAVLSPGDAATHLDSFQVVEGKIESVSLKENRIYLNFGADWRDDFTVSIAPGDKRAFIKAGLDPMQLNNKWIRARGWIRSYNGPYMEVDHPQALQVGIREEEPPVEKIDQSATLKGSALPAFDAPLHEKDEGSMVRP